MIAAQIVAGFVAIVRLVVLMSGGLVGGVVAARMRELSTLAGSLVGSSEKDFLWFWVVLTLPFGLILLAGFIWIWLYLASQLFQAYARFCTGPDLKNRQIYLAGMVSLLGVGLLVGSRWVTPCADQQVAAAGVRGNAVR